MVDMLPAQPLSQVVFVHDYLQLAFQGERFSLFNRVQVATPARSAMQGEPEFAGLLVALIDQRVTQILESPAAILELHFQNGSAVQVLRDEEFVAGPEAFTFEREGEPLVVGQN